ncbi:MAG: 3-hydroxyisobutyrate dehydrogenase [Pseudomonadota bacterium]
MATIAFIGLGNMGGGMAANLCNAGHSVRAFDLSEAAVSRAVDAGATAAASIAAAVDGVDAVITMLPAGPHVLSVYFDADGVSAHAPSSAILIDCSTIAVTDAREFVAQAEAAGFAAVDAPVSGGTAAADAGTLTFMVGGADDAFAKAQPLLANMGANVFHAGAPGNGQVAKVANNMLLGISMIATSEAFNLAEQLGLPADKFFEISSKASGQCWSMTSYCPAPGPVPASPANRDYEPGFTVAMMLKDLNLARDAATAAGADTAFGEQARQFYEALAEKGQEGKDFSVAMREIQSRN